MLDIRREPELSPLQRLWYAAKTLGSGVALYGSYASELPIQKPVVGPSGSALRSPLIATREFEYSERACQEKYTPMATNDSNFNTYK
ncbi:MAG: hypothetical protein ACOVLE_01915 [Pirellula staleyi]